MGSSVGIFPIGPILAEIQQIYCTFATLDVRRQRREKVIDERINVAAPPLVRIRTFRRHVTTPLDISNRGQLGGTGCGRCGPRYLVPTGGIHKVTHVFFV